MRLANLEAEMARNNVSPNDVAKVVGCSSETVRRWIRCENDLPTRKALEIRRAFFRDCGFEYLFEGLED